MESTGISSQLLECKDIWVVLENRYGDKYIESYELPNILYSNNEFWGKFRNVHSAYGHNELDQTQTLSYAYNNFSSIVCTSSLTARIQRYYSTFAYSSLNFIAKGHYRKIWDFNDGGRISELIESIKSGLRIKVKIESKDGYTYIIPAHTVEAYEKQNKFVVETEFDGYPEQLRHFSAIKDFQVKLDATLPQCQPPAYPVTKYTQTNSFFVTSFFITPRGVFHRGLAVDGKLKQNSFAHESAEIWVEIN